MAGVVVSAIPSRASVVVAFTAIFCAAQLWLRSKRDEPKPTAASRSGLFFLLTSGSPKQAQLFSPWSTDL